MSNLWDNLSLPINGENFTELLKCRNVVIERIVSSEQPEPQVYCQNQDEWVILIEGKAELKIKDDVFNLKTGDYLFIPAQTPHQVIKTSQNCIWLAIHIH